MNEEYFPFPHGPRRISYPMQRLLETGHKHKTDVSLLAICEKRRIEGTLYENQPKLKEFSDEEAVRDWKVNELEAYKGQLRMYISKIQKNCCAKVENRAFLADKNAVIKA